VSYYGTGDHGVAPWDLPDSQDHRPPEPTPGHQHIAMSPAQIAEMDKRQAILDERAVQEKARERAWTQVQHDPAATSLRCVKRLLEDGQIESALKEIDRWENEGGAIQYEVG